MCAFPIKRRTKSKASRNSLTMAGASAQRQIGRRRCEMLHPRKRKRKMPNSQHKAVDSSANYVPSLKGANPIKKSDDDDWWSEMCKKHNTKNHWKKEKKKLLDKEDDPSSDE